MKLKELNNLSNTELDISVAKLMGIKVESDGISHNLMACDLNTNTYNPNGKFLTFLPKYSSDLNAMNKAELTMREDQLYSYMLNLIETSGLLATHVLLAKARQRAEAFVLTKEGEV